jgi:hypothetical protein
MHMSSDGSRIREVVKMLWYIKGLCYVLILFGLGLVCEGYIKNMALVKIIGGVIFLWGLILRFD